VLHVQRFTTDTAGYSDLRKSVRAWPQRIWAVEGAGGVGKHFAQRLVADVEAVLDVPAKLSAQVRVFASTSRLHGQGRKTDATDAHSIALVASRATKLRAVQVDGAHIALRLLADRRDELGVRKTETANRVHRLLSELIGGGAKRFLSAAQAKTILAGIRPRDVVGKTRRQLAAELITELAALEQRIKVTNRQLTHLVAESGSRLMELNGIGPSGAARLLDDVGDIARFPTRGHFASWNGTAPIDASSGDSVHHRLSRSGNRRLNRVLHIVAIVQLRNPSPGREYYDRKRAEGKSAMEALRCLKRRLSDVVYRQMVTDA
ncbi:IS110 family RNA-guided transposase, partial [Kineococcus sp. SYSU DK018]|uniref:IS110 family transposase n=1 Tax=Kineococcus sp. SYSU DK018 TaxID=3383139 RepID=UPI003D7CB36A